MQPLISIITPVYRGEETLARAVKSAQAQDYPRWEMRIVSDDLQDYEKILADADVRDPRLKFSSTGIVSSGPSAARNVALAAAQGNFAANLDADDEFAPARLSAMLPLAQKYGACVSGIEIINEMGSWTVQNLSRRPADDFIRPEEAPYVCIHNSNVVLYDRTRVRHRYAEALRCMEDFVFLMQMYDGMEAIGYLNAPLYRYYKRPDSLTTQETVSKDFAETKKRILDMISSRCLSFQRKETEAAVLSFIHFSLSVEHHLQTRRQQDPDIFFDQILKEMLAVHVMETA